MYRVVLIDDEDWVLKGLGRLLDWTENGFQVAESYTDPVAARESILKSAPDVVFTDIKMPVLDGLELMRSVREVSPGCLFVVISGYASFDYVKTALRHGAFDYCLKPVDPEEGNALLGRIRLNLQTRDATRVVRLLDIIFEGNSESLDKMCLAGELPAGSHYLAVTLTARGGVNEGQWRALAVDQLRLDHGSIVTWPVGVCKCILLLSGGEDLRELTVRWLEEHVCSPGGIHAGVSALTQSVYDIRRVIQQSDMAAAADFVGGGGSPIEFFRSDDRGLLQHSLDAIDRALWEESPDRLAGLLEGLPGQFVEAGLGVYHAIKFHNALLALLLRRFGGNVFPALEHLEFTNYRDMLAWYDSFERLCGELANVLPGLCRTSERGEQSRPLNKSFRMLVEYVDQHYCQRISIGELSKSFYLNTSYCCELFKREMKCTFTEYVMKRRMERARQLIRQTDMDITAIAYEVGYSDYYYFSKSFKRYQGMTPTQYRTVSASG